jgi:hypothetical protein
MNTIKAMLLAALTLLSINISHAAEDDLLKPFILASKGAGSLAAKTEAAKTALAANGFTVVGTYSPYSTANILIITSDELKKNASESQFGGYGAAQRVSITKVKNEIQVSYTNPVYMANIYRMKNDLADVAAKLEKTLGKDQEFGSKGITAKKARNYHYMFGMEYFDEPSVLAEYSSYEEAIAAVEAGLAKKTEGVSKVFRIDVPGKQEAVFGVALSGKEGATKVTKEGTAGADDQFGGLMTGAPEADAFIMSVIDFGELKGSAHLPYEVLVSDKKVYALYARFRIALSYPNLKMMGSNSFMNIMESPEAIRIALQKTVTK